MQGWNPEVDERDKKDLDALAARGYYQAFQCGKNQSHGDTSYRRIR